MTLAAAQIINAVAVRMRNGTLAGADVYTSRAWPLSERDLPAWRVTAANEDVRPLTLSANPTQAHELQIDLSGYCQAVQDVDDSLHAITLEALGLLFPAVPGAPDALDALIPRVFLSLRRIERFMQTEGEATLGKVSITLLATYRTRASAPDTLV
jgi:hypothetical protein